MLMDYITMYIRLQPTSKSTAAAGTSQVALYIYIQIHICIYRATRTWLPATSYQRKSKQRLQLKRKRKGKLHTWPLT